MTTTFGDTSKNALEELAAEEKNEDYQRRAVKRALSYIDFLENRTSYLELRLSYYEQLRQREGDFWAGLMGHLEPYLMTLIEENVRDYMREK